MLNSIGSKIIKIFSSNNKILDEGLLSQIEENLILSDISIDLVDNIVDSLKKKKFNKNLTIDELKFFIKNILLDYINDSKNIDLIDKIKNNNGLYTIILSGVNGAGKTTTIAKIANLLKSNDLKVLLCAADTFRAVASEQLQVLANKADVDIIYSDNNISPASLIFDGYKKAINENYDVFLIDTAGRLQTKNDLMDELAKIVRVIKKQVENNSIASVLVLDASTGQNMISQIDTFLQFANITGFILTKLDGTSKGGAIFSLLKKYKLPIYFIGNGEKITDLKEFDIDEYLNNILEIH